MVAWKGRAPVGGHLDVASLGDMRLNLILRQVGEAETGEHRVQSERDVIERRGDDDGDQAKWIAPVGLGAL